MRAGVPLIKVADIVPVPDAPMTYRAVAPPGADPIAEWGSSVVQV
jgi:hypothetical protein